METNRNGQLTYKTIQRLDSLLASRYSIPEIARTLKIPEWKILDIVQVRFGRDEYQKEITSNQKKES